jgi:flagellar protein FlaG
MQQRNRAPSGALDPAAANNAGLLPKEADKTRSEEQRTAQEQQSQKDAPPALSSLRFQVDADTGRTIAELVDGQGQVLRQVPTEEALEVAKAIDKYQGMFVDLKV